MYTYMHTYISVYIYICIYIYREIYYICIYIYVYTYNIIFQGRGKAVPQSLHFTRSSVERSTVRFQKFNLEKWAQALELWTLRMHFQVESRHIICTNMYVCVYIYIYIYIDVLISDIIFGGHLPKGCPRRSPTRGGRAFGARNIIKHYMI